ncbi:hypothetical protein CORC01_09872 [Colletotrichum orchidophilum]|uniref:Uncharacterized protein n=1 Tax=Colletotrichum orchidophilum TaxID=1209926 RepID=A0A1G4B0E4_9PEZI|nr:uncharacterized protein CORC01_09872 [Colletotrichum orchidophilum]OHE94854.1 hypothetical protein CORC01_09872 [Colletotrichum orchidophilum]
MAATPHSNEKKVQAMSNYVAAFELIVYSPSSECLALLIDRLTGGIMIAPGQNWAGFPYRNSVGDQQDVWVPEYIVQLGDTNSWTDHFELLDRKDVLAWDKSTTKVIKIRGHHVSQDNRLVFRVVYEGQGDRNAGNVDEVWMRTYYPRLVREYWRRFRKASRKARKEGEGRRPPTDEWWDRAAPEIRHRHWLNFLTNRPRNLPRLRFRDRIAGAFGRWEDADPIPPR